MMADLLWERSKDPLVLTFSLQSPRKHSTQLDSTWSSFPGDLQPRLCIVRGYESILEADTSPQAFNSSALWGVCNR